MYSVEDSINSKGHDSYARLKKDTVFNETHKDSRCQQRHLTSNSGYHDVFPRKV